METVHTFAGNPLDRAATKVKDEAWLEQQLTNSNSRFLPFAKLKVKLNSNGDGQPELDWRSRDQLSAPTLTTFLGMQNNRAHFAAALDPSTVDTDDFIDVRSAAMSLADADSGIVAQARAQLEWHKRNGFCAACGSPTEPGRGGLIRSCQGCKARHFPRTDPVVIMLISRGDRALLGQPNGPMAGSGFYTALAGFVDAAESIEEAVRRETFEEAGVRVGEVRYHSSQPWPFPHSLMIGCQAHALTEHINLDPSEMADVRWFTRAELAAVLDQRMQQQQQVLRQDLQQGTGLPVTRVPGSIAIAYHLIQSWLNDEPLSRFG